MEAMSARLDDMQLRCPVLALKNHQPFHNQEVQRTSSLKTCRDNLRSLLFHQVFGPHMHALESAILA